MPSRTTLSSLLLLPFLTSALSLDCKHIRADKVSFNLAKLGGPKTVHLLEAAPPSIHNTTFTLDICKNLEKPKGSKKDEECGTGTRVCGKEYTCRSGNCQLDEVIPIAGEYTLSEGSPLEPKFTRLKNSDSNSDADLEGLRMELHGGSYKKVDQKAIIEFVCDREYTGNEGFEDDASRLLSSSSSGNLTALEDSTDDDGNDSGDLPDLDKGKALQLVGYKTEEDEGVLRLKWKTKYGCEDAYGEKDPDDKSSNGWGFFTWLLIIVFLLAAAYIIFGSWLNYNRYGARGWDLLPHGDTIRDIPYILWDWAGNLTDKLRGDSRGGYSAV